MQIYRKEIQIFRYLLLLCIPLLILAVILPKGEKAQTETEDGTFILLLSEVDEAFRPNLHIGDRVVDRQNRSILGDILEIRTEESQREVFSETTGTLIFSRVPERCDIFLTVSAKKENGVCQTMGGDPLLLGQTYHFRTYDFTGTGRVVALL
jgi:hypothetical protein